MKTSFSRPESCTCVPVWYVVPVKYEMTWLRTYDLLVRKESNFLQCEEAIGSYLYHNFLTVTTRELKKLVFFQSEEVVCRYLQIPSVWAYGYFRLSSFLLEMFPSDMCLLWFFAWFMNSWIGYGDKLLRPTARCLCLFFEFLHDGSRLSRAQHNSYF